MVFLLRWRQEYPALGSNARVFGHLKHSLFWRQSGFARLARFAQSYYSESARKALLVDDAVGACRSVDSAVGDKSEWI